MQFIELLAPAKDAESGIIAINHGADAVYIGAPSFSARAAAGCSIDEIAKLVDYACMFSAKVYVALNTILFDNELSEAVRLIEKLYNAGADAIIIQDMGLLECDLPPVAIHASTQTHNNSPEKIEFLASAGISRIILARELSLESIRNIHKLNPKVELEAFVHGSLCVSYSGRCHLSQMVAGRSGNRGVCAQPCRSSYDLLNNNGDIIIRDKHILSIKDLNRTEYISEMAGAGITSFKIEGRLKDNAYIKNITAWYRRHLDKIAEGSNLYKKSSEGNTEFYFNPDPERTFNRGYTTYFLNNCGKNNREKIGTPSTQKSMGKYIGNVARVRGREIMIDTVYEINNGDGLCYTEPNGKLCGFLANRVNGFWILPNKALSIKEGTPVYRNHDHIFLNTLSADTSRRSIDIVLRLCKNNGRYALEAKSENGLTVTVASAFEPAPAKNKEKALNIINEQLSKTGNSIFRVKNIITDLEDIPFLPVSELNSLRREAVEQLTAIHKKRSKPAPPYKKQAVSKDYFKDSLDYRANVSNNKAKEFYLKRGVKNIEPALEITPADGLSRTVMTTRYCIRFENGRCPRHSSTTKDIINKAEIPDDLWKEPLYIKDLTNAFSVHFDCSECEMTIKIIPPSDLPHK